MMKKPQSDAVEDVKKVAHRTLVGSRKRLRDVAIPAT